MIANVVYPALAGHAPLTAIVGSRIYRDFAGDAPVAPYAVWSILATVPSENLSGRPPSDRYSVSVDVFSPRDPGPGLSEALVRAARDAMEGIGVMSSGPQSLGFDPDTQLWRWTFTTDVFKNR